MSFHERPPTTHSLLNHWEAESREQAMGLMFKAMHAPVRVADSFQDGSQMLGEVLCAVLEDLSAGTPATTAFGNIREDAEFWADCATPAELEACIAAGLKRVNRTTFATNARKRLFMTLWRSFTDQERKAFITKMGEKPP